jgi:predicted AlkP superfamily pyrophosphatase or phosphodiesterase
MKKIFLSIYVLSLACSAEPFAKRPKLVVGIVVDQMRNDYLRRFSEDFGRDGFNKIIAGGAYFSNAHYNYVPTYTAPGHASIYTGTTPALHGIVGNAWFDRYNNQNAYCVGDSTVKGIGSESKMGLMSPKNLKSSTIADELRLATLNKGRAYGVSIKDRGAILPVGQSANAAYWFADKNEGNFISSSYYMDSLPLWVAKFNQHKLADKLGNQTWDLLRAPHHYAKSRADNFTGETLLKGKETPTFPYDLSELRAQNGNYALLTQSPFGNTLVREFAQNLIREEQLGKKDATDFIAISFSSTDKVGHGFGAYSKEIQDTYLRLDEEFAQLLSFLDLHIGKENYLLFITADHAGMDIPSYYATQKINAASFDASALTQKMQSKLQEKFGKENWIQSVQNSQFYLNQNLARAKNVPLALLKEELTFWLNQEPDIRIASSFDNKQGLDNWTANFVSNGYYAKRSGDVFYVLADFHSENGGAPATHGSMQSYDTQVPVIFYGKGIKQMRINRQINITDIAPTLCNLLDINVPSSSSGAVITEITNYVGKSR